MNYAISLIPNARKDLDDVKGKDFEYIKNKIIALSSNPRPFGSQKLTNEEGYRVRAGDFRILYRIEDSSRHVIIYRVKRRSHAYR